MEKFFQKRVTHYLLIIFVALLSIGQILRLYFGFEDFHLFYIFQDSEEAKRLLVIPEYARHLNQYYFERPLWNFFGYNPFGYNTFTLILSICVYLLYYRFISYVTKNKFIGLISAIYLASAYYGVDSFTWSYNTGFDLMGALAPGIILFAMLFAYLRTKK